MRTLTLSACLLLAGLVCSAQQILELDRNEDGSIDQWYESRNGAVVGIRFDRDFDGAVDYVVRFDADGSKSYEEYDFNYDELMDDFYYYERGVLIRQEVDSNFDGSVDLWVFLYKGIYIRRYEQDTDHDGKVDRVVDYDDA